MREFVQKYGGIYEHSPWVAERVEALLPGRVPDREGVPRTSMPWNPDSARATRRVRRPPGYAKTMAKYSQFEVKSKNYRNILGIHGISQEGNVQLRNSDTTSALFLWPEGRSVRPTADWRTTAEERPAAIA